MNADNADSDRLFEQRARELLRASAARVDDRTASRLVQARSAAVEEMRNRNRLWRSWMPLGGVAAAAVAVLVWSGGLHRSHMADPTQVRAPFEDLELMIAEENLELIEDLEFYAWLDSDSAQDLLEVNRS